MWRRVGFSLVCFTTILWVLCIIFWIRGQWYHSESVSISSPIFTVQLGAFDKHLVLGGGVREVPIGDPAWELGFEQQPTVEEIVIPINIMNFLADVADHSFSLIGIRLFIIQGHLMLAVPFAYPAALFPLPMIWWTLRYRKTSKPYRRKRGLCLGCGYDLRGTTGTCPECGHAMTNSPSK